METEEFKQALITSGEGIMYFYFEFKKSGEYTTPQKIKAISFYFSQTGEELEKKLNDYKSTRPANDELVRRSTEIVRDLNETPEKAKEFRDYNQLGERLTTICEKIDTAVGRGYYQRNNAKSLMDILRIENS